MTKQEACRSIATLTSGTLAHLTGRNRYRDLDAILCKWLQAIQDLPEDTFVKCKDWQDVFRRIRPLIDEILI